MTGEVSPCEMIDYSFISRRIAYMAQPEPADIRCLNKDEFNKVETETTKSRARDSWFVACNTATK